MNMHDNDIDALFRSKLDGLEAEPSARVWDNISTELHGAGNRRKGFVPLLRIAGSIAVLIAAGLFFLPRNKKVYQAQPIKNRLVKTTIVKPAVNTPSTVQQPADTATQVQQAAGVSQQPQQLAAVHQAKTRPMIVKTAAKQPAVIPNPVASSTVADNQQALMAAVQNKVNVTKPVVPDTQISPKIIDAEPVTDSKPASVLAAANITDGENDTKPAPAKKHKARGFGGILNAMIGVVDKRQDKIIEFTDTDEGDTITGINLGIVKIKKQK